MKKKLLFFLFCVTIGAISFVLVRSADPIPVLTVHKEQRQTWREKILDTTTQFSQKSYALFDQIKETILYHMNRLFIKIYVSFAPKE